MRFAGMAVVVALVLAGCGGGAAQETAPTKTTAPTATPKASEPAPTVAPPTGVPAPEDLTDFRCAADDKGVWNASGVLENESKRRATYQVTVYVGEADGKDSEARTKQVRSVLAGGSTRVELTKIPAAEGSSQCYVQVLRKQ